MITKKDLQNLVNESRSMSTRMLNAIRDYLAENKCVFLETNIAENEYGEYVLNGIDTEELDTYLWMQVCVSSFNEDWRNVMVIGIAENKDRYSGGATIFYLNNGEEEIKTATLNDVSTNDYENILVLLSSGTAFDLSEIPEL